MICRCEGYENCLENCKKKDLFTPSLEDDRGSCYHNNHKDGMHHEYDPYVLVKCKFCGEKLGFFPEQSGLFVGCSTIHNYGTKEESFCEGYWECHGGSTVEESLNHYKETKCD